MLAPAHTDLHNAFLLQASLVLSLARTPSRPMPCKPIKEWPTHEDPGLAMKLCCPQLAVLQANGCKCPDLALACVCPLYVMTFWTVSPKPVQKSPAKKSVTPKTTLAPEQVKVKESPANKPLTAPAPESMKRELPTSGLAALNELESVTMTEVKKVSPAMKKIKFCKDGAKFLKGVGKLIPLDLVGLPSISTCCQPIEVCADIADLIHQSCMGEDESGVHILVEGKDKDGKMHEYLMHDERPCCMKANKDNLGSQIAMRAYTGPEDKNPTLFKTSTTRYMLCCVGELPEKSASASLDPTRPTLGSSDSVAPHLLLCSAAHPKGIRPPGIATTSPHRSPGSLLQCPFASAPSAHTALRTTRTALPRTSTPLRSTCRPLCLSSASLRGPPPAKRTHRSTSSSSSAPLASYLAS